MSVVRQTTTRRVTRLAVKSSPYHAAVTFYEAQDDAGPSTSRRHSTRSTRAKPEDIASEEGTANELSLSKSKKARSEPKVEAMMTVEGVNHRSPLKKPKKIPQSLDVPHPSPERWKEVYDSIKEMRSRITAPVDTMGCDQAQWKEQDPKVCKPWLVSL